ncbi:Adaptor protein complex AP-3 delta subunit [Choiromyces venosus 120613-1]|uniref:AP-3 complex subunit delta n=1 Tax=Choiromyces venosus 120613-1 TaxID=1336337 RepID=A0A3N4J1U3_9PEZI|nr:Adaptor protein complex AP-3 delta subunit [Choiromyces venosus 120613-1]
MLECLKECRNEVRSQDLDIKAAAILKLVYLEMFGHDMSWASFHVLEVMSSPKFVQKRVGYLAATQSFTIETDVLMLTTNLIKKDLSSLYLPETALAINGTSHIASPSLARDLSPDLLSKLSHTSPHIRKKTVLVLYKCFLQSPELLRTSWPRLRECLNDEDGSVVSATVNVVCELARRNPRNYLPLAPQLFRLLTDRENNWMTIKLIKLFATLTPLEPRLIKKLIPPITNLIMTTPAMSLLYECINGLISGGLLAGIQETDEGEELASVCVTKLRGFLVEGDSNLKYVGLLALTKLVVTHAHLVSIHQDVILDCIDDADISIRYRALELVVGMVNSDSLPGVVGRLIRQLKPNTNRTEEEFVELEATGDESEDEDMEEEVMHPRRTRGEVVPLELPEDYKRAVITSIVEMCSRDMYANVGDFEWYLDVLIQLIRYAPPASTSSTGDEGEEMEEEDQGESDRQDVGEAIGHELRNVAVRVRSVRGEAVRYAEMLVGKREGMFPVAGGGGRRVLGAAGWIVGEYASLLTEPNETLSALLHSSLPLLPTDILAIYIQAVPKIYAVLAGAENAAWTLPRKSTVALLTSKIIKFLEPLAISPNLEVQERAVEFLELFRLAGEAVAEQPATAEDADEQYDAPLLITQAIPGMFLGLELNPVAPRAQRKVPLPVGLDLDEPINPYLHQLLLESEQGSRFAGDNDEDDGFREWYYQKAVPKQANIPASLGIDNAASKNLSAVASYQSGDMKEEDYLDKDILERRKRERRERNRDDPFYIGGAVVSGGDEEVDLDSIPVMKLDLGDVNIPATPQPQPRTSQSKKKREKVVIAADEGIGNEGDESPTEETVEKSKRKPRKGLLQVDSSGLMGYSLDEPSDSAAGQEEDVKAARKEVERFRAEMERAAERVKARTSTEEPKEKKKKKKKKGEGGDGEGKKKKKKMGDAVEAAEGEVKKRKKKKAKKDKEGQKETAEI